MTTNLGGIGKETLGQDNAHKSLAQSTNRIRDYYNRWGEIALREVSRQGSRTKCRKKMMTDGRKGSAAEIGDEGGLADNRDAGKRILEQEQTEATKDLRGLAPRLMARRSLLLKFEATSTESG
jgi:hypothetical protein